MIEVSRWTLVVLILFVAVLVLLLFSVVHQRKTSVSVPDIESFAEALPSITGMTGVSVIPGNRVQVLQNGDQFFPALLSDIAAAKQTIDIETYVWWRGEICARVAGALAAKARQGVEVRLTVDAFGAHLMDNRLAAEMRAAGVRILAYHPLAWNSLGLINNRTHRKVAVFDGRVGHIFGLGIAEEWTGHAQDARHWRDTGLRLEGPIAGALQGVFAENWVEGTGEVLVGEKYFPRPVAAGTVRVHVEASSPHGGVSDLELLLKMAIASAQKEVIIENPYFIPNQDLVALLGRAVRRGVDVKLLLPGPVSDSKLVEHAGHYHYDELLRKGIKIYEFQPTLNHQKIMIVDGLWSLVGSTNLDDRSIYINDEASVGVIDAGVAGELKAAFARDLQRAVRILPAAWARRGLWDRFLDRTCYAVNMEI
ncbi:MAG TPA: phospholipase D-like domain-containing protein [Thermoanaerobaculia bacterium]|nr:phospholipase D-like domain-containing protein [Thermoanaerobaculia bacterium]